MNSFARDLGISKSLLSLIFSGDRGITMRLAVQISMALDLTESQSKALMLSVVQASSKNAKISKKVRARLTQELSVNKDEHEPLVFTTVDIEQFKAMSNWYHFALLNLTRVEGFKHDPIWIAKQLGISTLEARDALERLISLGFLKLVDEKIQNTVGDIQIKPRKSELAIRNFHEQMINKAKDELKKTSPKHYSQRLINGVTLVCGQNQIELIKDKIDKFQDEILSLAGASAGECLYQMNVQFFPLTNTEPGDNQ
jgi:uncharacterized protein (TIGR02147 family)